MDYWKDIQNGKQGVRLIDNFLFVGSEEHDWLRFTKRVEQDGLEHQNLGVAFKVRTDLNREQVVSPKSLNICPIQQWQPDEDHTWLLIELQDLSQKDLYFTLVSDLIETYSSVINDDEKAHNETVVDRLLSWIDFMAKGRKRILPPEKRRGLYGEMVFFRDYVLPIFESKSIDHWKGITPELVDFVFGDIGVEIKTSASTKPYEVKIANSKQLDESHWGELYLFHLALTVTSGEGENLVTLYHEIKDKLSATAANKFDSNLKKFGFYFSDAESYENEKYSVNECNVYRVVEDFPRLKPGSLMNGVGKVTYSISLSSSEEYKLDLKEFESILNKI